MSSIERKNQREFGTGNNASIPDYISREDGSSKLPMMSEEEDNVITLNVGGVIFKTFISTLLSVPNTRLYRRVQQIQNTEQDVKSKEYFFDRNPAIFECVLELYRSGELHFPRTICSSTLKRDLDFWDIPLDMVAECCQDNITAAEKEIEWRKNLKSKFTSRQSHCLAPEENAFWLRKVQYKLYYIVDKPLASIQGMIYGAIYSLFTLANVIYVILLSHPTFRVPINPALLAKLSQENISNPKQLMMLTTLDHPVLAAIKTACFVFFCLEMCFRFLVYPRKKAFFKTYVNLLDIVCLCMNIIQLSLTFSLQGVYPYSDDVRGLTSLFLFLSSVTVLRIIRLVTYSYNFSLMRVLVLSLYESWKVLFLMVVVLIIGMCIFSPLMYLADFYVDQTFPDIPTACWWAIVTMTTVGYGDHHPKSFTGYIVGTLCALTGIVLTALPIAVVGSNFHHFYSYYKDCQLVNPEDVKKLHKDRKSTRTVEHKGSPELVFFSSN